METATTATAGAGVTSYLWLPSLTPWLQLLFLVLSCSWIAIQIYFKLFKKEAK
jgi:hypothetical protein